MRFLAAAAVVAVCWGQTDSVESLRPLGVVPLQGNVFHVQGVDTDGKRLWVTSVDTANRKGYLHEFSFDSGELARSVEVQAGDRFHAGGFASDAESLWIPVAEYRASSSSVIQKRSKRTLEVEFEFPVADHIGCLAVTSDAVIGGNWDSREFYVWNHQGKLLRKVALKTGNGYQDLKMVGRKLVASGLLADKTGAIDWLDPESFELGRRMRAGKTDRGFVYTREGMAIFGNRLLLLPEDGPTRLFMFDLGK